MRYLIYVLIFSVILTAGCLKNDSSSGDVSNSVSTTQTDSGELRGQIVDSLNAPVSDLSVTVEKLVSGKAAVVSKAGQKISSNYLAKTDKNGFYSFKNIPAGEYFVNAVLESKNMKAYKKDVTVRSNAVTDLGSIQLTPTGSITGSVTRYGNALENAMIFILGTSYNGSTNSSGQYTLTEIPAGTYTVTAMHTNSSGLTYMASKSVTVTGGSTATCDTIAVKSGFYVIRGPKEKEDLTNNGKGWDPSSMSFTMDFSQTLYSADNFKSSISISPDDKSYVITASDSGSFSFAASNGYASGFNYGTTYTVTVSTTCKDKSSTALGSSYSYSFTTKTAKDSDKKIAATSPEASSTDIKTTTTIVLYYTELMDRSSVEESLTIKNSSGTSIEYSTSWVSDSPNDLDVLTITPLGDTKNVYEPTHLAENEKYTVSVGGKTFGQTSVSTYSFDFTTGLEGIYITSDTTWSSDKTYSVPVYITNGVTLTINAGVIVNLNKSTNGSGLEGAINTRPRNYSPGNGTWSSTDRGIIKSNGTTSSHISFKTDSTSNIMVEPGNASAITYTDFEKFMLLTYANGTTSSDVWSITHCYFNDSVIIVNDTTSADATSSITNNTFRYALSTNDHAIEIANSSCQVYIASNNIQDNYDGIYTGALDDMNIKISSNNIYNNTHNNLYFSSGPTEEIHITSNYFGTTTNSIFVGENYLTTSNFLGFDSGWFTSSAVSSTGQ